MRMHFGIGLATLAASVVLPAAFGQNPPAPPAPAPAPRARAAATFFAQKEVSFLGVGVKDVTSERAKALKLNVERGAEVSEVTEDGPAAKAGIKEGDVVLEYNGQPVEGQEQLGRLVRETPAGRQVKVTVWRNGNDQTLVATVGSHRVLESGDGTWTIPEVKIPPIPPVVIPPIEFPQLQTVWQSSLLGLVGETVQRDSQLAEFFGVKEGVLVKSVTRNSPAEKAGIKAGDIIVKVDDSNISSSRDLTSALRSLRTKRTVPVTVVRNKKETPLTVTLEGSGRERAQWFEGAGRLSDWFAAFPQ